MRLLNGIVPCVMSMVAFAGTACAQDRLVPAGTLLRCVMDELNSSPATSAVGDPVLCRLRTFEQFGRPVFPKGAMLGGHLEDLKDPGRFSGKGYAITFDRVILPYGDLAVLAKVIQAKKVKVSKTGDINSEQDAKRHSGWLMPPLWTWKLVSVPVRGPRPQVKRAEQLELRIMDDILIPATLVYGSMKPDHPPYTGSTERNVFFDSEGKSSLGLTMLVLKSDEVYAISKFHVDGRVLKFEDSSGAAGVVDANEIDWHRNVCRVRQSSPASRVQTEASYPGTNCKMVWLRLRFTRAITFKRRSIYPILPSVIPRLAIETSGDFRKPAVI